MFVYARKHFLGAVIEGWCSEVPLSQGCVECILSRRLCTFIAMLIAREKKQYEFGASCETEE